MVRVPAPRRHGEPTGQGQPVQGAVPLASHAVALHAPARGAGGVTMPGRMRSPSFAGTVPKPAKARPFRVCRLPPPCPGARRRGRLAAARGESPSLKNSLRGDRARFCAIDLPEPREVNLLTRMARDHCRPNSKFRPRSWSEANGRQTWRSRRHLNRRPDIAVTTEVEPPPQMRLHDHLIPSDDRERPRTTPRSIGLARGHRPG